MYQQILLWLVIPMSPHKEWLKLYAYEHRLPEMVKTVKQLQKEIDALKAQLKES